jgi:hypothetical protein
LRLSNNKMQFVHHNRIYWFGYSTEQIKLNLRLYAIQLRTIASVQKPHTSLSWSKNGLSLNFQLPVKCPVPWVSVHTRVRTIKVSILFRLSTMTNYNVFMTYCLLLSTTNLAGMIWVLLVHYSAVSQDH